jgi:protein TonB
MPVQMAGHVDILEQRDSLRTPLLLSVIVHGAVFSSLALFTSLGVKGVLWGDPHAVGGGNSVGIQAVRQIPLPGRSGEQNLLANDTESRVPQPPKPQPKVVKPPEPEAIPLRSRKTAAPPPRPVQARETSQPYRAQPDRPNQLYSSAGQRLSSNMYGSPLAGTSGTVGVGPRGNFGQRYGWYSALLEQRVGQKWRTDEVDPRVQTAPPVIITFDIAKDGSARNVRILQSSGNRTLDYSAQRAIFEAAPFPPLPGDFERDSAQIEFWFQLRR